MSVCEAEVTTPQASSAVVTHLAVVAGGRGARLAAMFPDLPKPLVPVGGKPVLQHQLEAAAAAGITQATIFAGHQAEQIIAFVGDGSRFGLSVRVSVEAEPLGNAGAVLGALDDLPEQFFVLYGDVMLAVDFQKMARLHLDRGADLTALAHPNDHPQDSDLLDVDADDWITAVQPYPHPDDRAFNNLVNAALYVVRRDALRPWSGRVGAMDFTRQVLPELTAQGGRVLAYRSFEYIKDMGTPERLARVEADWRAGRIRLQTASARRPAVFLDRDGTLNVEKGFLSSPDELELTPNSAQALRMLREAGYRLVVLTNQPVIARGEASESDLAAIHRRLEWDLGKGGAFVDAIYHCPHHPDSGFAGERPELKIACDCRKPAIGLFKRACRELHIDPAGSWMIGDQTRDIEMARRAGLRSILVLSGAAGQDGAFGAAPDHVVDDIAAAAELIAGSGQAAKA